MQSLAGRLISFQSIMEEPLPPIEWVVESLIPHNNRMVVFGEFGSKKSWLLLDLSLHIASGLKWLDKYSIPQSRSVLYIDEEMSQYELRRRVKRLGIGAGLKGKQIPFRAISHLGFRFKAGKADELLKSVKAEGFDPDIVMVETLRRVLVGSENEAEDISELWHSVSPILDAGKTLIISHHMRKASIGVREEVRNRASGSTDILAGADCAFAVVREKGDLLRLECVKSRTAKEYEPFRFRLLDNVEVESSYLAPAEGNLPPEEAMTEERRAIILIEEYYTQAGSAVVKTKDLYARLLAEDISMRTAERAHEAYRRIAALQQVSRGQ
jgi:hypothetical protein